MEFIVKKRTFYGREIEGVVSTKNIATFSNAMINMIVSWLNLTNSHPEGWMPNYHKQSISKNIKSLK